MPDKIKKELMSEVEERELNDKIRATSRIDTPEYDSFDLRDYCIRVSGRFRDWVYYMRGSTKCRRRYVDPEIPDSPEIKLNHLKFAYAGQLYSNLTGFDKEAWKILSAVRKMQLNGSLLTKLFLRNLNDRNSYFNLIHSLKPEKITTRSACFSFLCPAAGSIELDITDITPGCPPENSPGCQVAFELSEKPEPENDRYTGRMTLTGLKPDREYQFQLLQHQQPLSSPDLISFQARLDRLRLKLKLDDILTIDHLPAPASLTGETGFYRFVTPSPGDFQNFLTSLDHQNSSLTQQQKG